MQPDAHTGVNNSVGAKAVRECFEGYMNSLIQTLEIYSRLISA
jgi:hypothetical protein